MRPHSRLYFLNVGQGDAALLITPDGVTALVDGGDTDPLRSAWPGPATVRSSEPGKRRRTSTRRLAGQVAIRSTR